MAMEGSAEPQPRKKVPTSTGPGSRRYVGDPGATLVPGSVKVNPASGRHPDLRDGCGWWTKYVGEH
jgi:hypothetical protein